MAASFNEQFGQYGAWRRGFASQLQELREWLMAQDLLDASVQERLQRLEDQMRSDKVMVAFVAEFSRGKSELINAIFFAHYGRRLMPASAGRTTMCPAELGWEAQLAPSLRLLPIDTRESHESLGQWRMRSDAWAQYPLDIGDAQQIVDTLAKVTAVRKVSVDQARALGFWHDDEEADNPMVDADGWVEVPMWRHALINMPHPLLKQGLVILDTPGLNAVGAEPELTVNLIPQAHAVVFVLGADTGVTKSDLAIWRDHVLPAGTGKAGANDAQAASRLVVLNKVDTLWDSLSSGAQVQAQLRRQQQDSANLLGVSVDKVLPVSAQKGLVAKVSRNAALLQASGLPAFEDLLANGIMGQRQKVLQAAVYASVQQLQWQVERVINMRRSELDDQLAELCGLRGKNTNVIAGMRSRIEGESNEFDLSAAKINAMRAEHMRMLKDIFQLLSSAALKSELAQLKQALDQRGLKLGVRKIYEQTFERLHAVAVNVLAQAEEMQKLMSTTFKELNAEFSFSLQVPPALILSDFTEDLRSIEGSYTQYIGLSSTLKLSNADFSQRLIKALALRLRTVFEAASSDVEMWSKSLTAPVDAQLRERKRSYTRRLEAVDRISGATTELEDRIADMENAQDQLGLLQTQLASASAKLLAPIEAERAKSAGAALDINLVV
ncbi:dynamin family protein [Comamonas sp. Y33R10-2]|uniref:dynamin family protein n=1 Tax=Comamonas sp. Y33R10-2 TaxID=2853257 RepID=UPI001C5CBEA2|nr:dynamin family protein [Comamonas sp. Y33R10-2]QXZ09955.1 dynamin family protein [Comamonas sp. Y33R10-2]